MVSTIANYLEAGYDLGIIKQYALISPSIASELQWYIATINDNDEEDKYSEDLYRFCSVQMKLNNENYEETWSSWHLEEDLDNEYVGALRRIMRLWQPEMFTQYGLNKMAEQLIRLLNSEYLEVFWNDPGYYFEHYLENYSNFLKDLIPVLNVRADDAIGLITAYDEEVRRCEEVVSKAIREALAEAVALEIALTTAQTVAGRIDAGQIGTHRVK